MINQDLHLNTPLLESVALSNRINGRVWLKIEAMQPSSSFKLRGIGHACRHYVNNGARRLVSSSGGNAGLAVAYSGRKLSIPVTVVVPQTTTQRAIELIEQEGAELIVHGETWQEAHEYALSLTRGDQVCIHPFDDPLLWEGHATIIDEIAKTGLRLDTVVLSVGGGGLLCGVIEGLHRNDMADVPVLAVETVGAHSLAASLKAGKHIELDAITSIATTLGAKRVAKQAYDWCSKHRVFSHVVSDKDAVEACLQFSSDQRILVEPACGASLAAVYNQAEFLEDKRTILVIVCGGAGVSIAQLQQWKEHLNT